MKKIKETQTGPIVSFNYDDEIAEITGVSTSFEPSQEGIPSIHTETGDIVTFDAVEATKIKDVSAEIVPAQDLHGYSKPWAPGNGKNKLRYPYSNSSGTYSGVSVTVNSDGTITLNGTATARVIFYVENRNDSFDLQNGQYIATCEGIPNDCGLMVEAYNGSTWIKQLAQIRPIVPSGQFVIDHDGYDRVSVYLYINSGAALNNVTIKPMIRLASETDASFAPYSNICPISGWTEEKIARTGKNLLDKSLMTNFSTTAQSVQLNLKPNTTYTMSTTHPLSSVSSAFVFFVLSVSAFNTPANGVWNGNPRTITTGSNGIAYVIYRKLDSETEEQFQSYDYQVELGSTASACEPYRANDVYTISLGGTRYGGTLDVTSGVMVIDRQIYRVGDLTWSYNAGGRYISNALSGLKPPADNSTPVSNSISSAFTVAGINYTPNIVGSYGLSTGLLVSVNAFMGSDVDAFKTAYADETFLFELATPLTVQLTPTQIEALIGKNNLWASTGAITVTYGEEYPIKGWDKIKVFVSPTEEEEDATIYESQFGSTEYSGTIDVTAGELTTDMGHIASYNGESIGEPWLSSLDPYVSGTTPSIGAEVVYTLDEPQTYDVPPQLIEALAGPNNIWSDTDEEVTVKWAHAPVLSEAVMLNGKYLEMAIDGYTTLGTSGRRSLGREIDAYTVGTADGETVKNSRFPVRKITVNYVIQTDTEEELTEAINQLANILNQDECDFVFRDEPDKFFSGYGLLDSEPKKYRHVVKGTWSLYCAYPFKRSNKLVELSSKDPTVASVESHSATFVFDYKGTLPARPILRAEFASAKSGGEYNEDGDCGYVAFLDAEENIIQLGNPEVLDVDQYANATLINREFDTLSDWTASGVTVGNITDQFWQNGKGQTQSYAKGTGSFTKSVGNGAINMEFDIVHRLCVSAANQTGAFECYAKNGNTIVVGFKIEKTGSGTTGTVSYILNGKVVGTDSIDLSYYNTHFGYCNRTAVYGTEYYSVYEKYYVKKKGKKKKKYHWVTYPRTVQTGWSYTQSNLNSGWTKDGPVVIFSVGNLPDRTFKSSDVELTPSTSIVFNISGSFHTNAVHSCAMLSKAGVPFAEIPNVFTAGDVVEGDCNSADVMLYRKGSLEGHLEPQYGALGNDWEDFEIKPGKNIIRAVWSDWVNTSYKPEIKIIFNEVYV